MACDCREAAHAAEVAALKSELERAREEVKILADRLGAVALLYLDDAALAPAPPSGAR